MQLAILLGSLAGINILLAFIYQWYVVTILGPGIETDALFIGMAVPQLVLTIVTGSLTSVLVPLLANEEGNRFYLTAWSVLQSIGLVFTGITLLLFITATIWVPWIAPGFDSQAVSLTISLVRIQLLGVVFMALISVLSSVNYAHQKFVWVEFSAIVANSIGFSFLVWGLPRFGVSAAAWAMVLRTILQTILLVRETGSYQKPDWNSESLKTAWQRMRPLLLGSAYYKTDQLLDRVLASMTPIGGITLLNLAQQLYGAGNAILSKAIVSPMVPQLARQVNTSNWQNFSKILHKRLLIVFSITSIGFLVIFLVGEPILTLLFKRKSFVAEDVISLYWLLIALGGVWMGANMGAISSSAYYAKGDTHTPTKLGIWTYTLYIPVKVIAFIYFGITGLAVSTSAFFLVNFVLQLFFLEKTLNEYQ